MTPTQSGTAAITAAGISSILGWIIPLVIHISPPADVVTALAALILWIGHAVAVRVGTKTP
jgi:hypothetical protein